MRLTRATTGPLSVLDRHGGGILAVLFGAAALLAGFWTQFGTQRQLTEASDLRIVLPFAALTLIAAVVSFIRRERLRELAVGGLAMALAAPLLGWVVLVGAVAGGAIIVMLVVAKLH